MNKNDSGRTAGQRADSTWRMFERIGPLILVAVAFILEWVALFMPGSIAGSLANISLAAGIGLLIVMVLDIHRQTFRPPPTRHYEPFFEIRKDIIDRLELAAGKDALLIQSIGLSLERQWSLISEFLSSVAEDRNGVSITIETVHLDPEWERLEQFNKHLSGMGREIVRRIEDFREVYAEKFKSSWKLNVVAIQQFPLVSGILINENDLYRTLCDIDTQRKCIVQGEKLYEFFDYDEPQNEFDRETVEHFKRVLEYYKKIGTGTPDLSAETDSQADG